MNFGLITVNSFFFDSVFCNGIIYKAIKNNLIKINFWNPRDYVLTNKIDGKIYGGGPGVILKPEPLFCAINDAKKFYKKKFCVVYLSPQGKILNKKIIFKLLKFKSNIFICGRYNGIDQRIIDKYVDYELSIGDYVVSCGEISVLVVIDSIVRNLPGVLNNIKSSYLDSFSNYNGLLGNPNYTRPKIFQGMKVPDVLFSGNHKYINFWKFKKSLEQTFLKKPYLLKKKKIKKKLMFILNKIKNK